MSNKIRVIIKEPGKNAREAQIESTLKTFQDLVGGHIEGVNLYGNVFFYVDEEGKFKNKKPNFLYCGDVIVGTAVFFGRGFDGEEISLTDNQVFTIKILLPIQEQFLVSFSELRRR